MQLTWNWSHCVDLRWLKVFAAKIWASLPVWEQKRYGRWSLPVFLCVMTRAVAPASNHSLPLRTGWLREGVAPALSWERSQVWALRRVDLGVAQIGEREQPVSWSVSLLGWEGAGEEVPGARGSVNTPSWTLSQICAPVPACVRGCTLSHVWLFSTPWMVADQTPLSMEFSRQEYWSGLPFPSPWDLLHSEIEPASLFSPALAGGPPRKPVSLIEHFSLWAGRNFLSNRQRGFIGCNYYYF